MLSRRRGIQQTWLGFFFHLNNQIIWSIFPTAAAYILLIEEKLYIGLSMLLLSIILFGVVGFLIWLHAFCDLPHDW